MDPFFSLDAGPWRDMGNGQQQRVLHLEGMTAMLLRLPAGASTDPEHYHPHEQIACVVSGRVRMTIGAQARVLNAGDGYRVPSGIKHHVQALEDAVIMDCFSPKREDLWATE